MSRKHGPARGVRGFVRRFLQRPGSADLRRARRIAAAAAAKEPGSVPAEGTWGDGEIAAFLDPSLSYSSALFDRSRPVADQDLEEAQLRKVNAALDLAGVGAGGAS